MDTLTADNGDWEIVVNGDGTYTVNQLQVMTHPDDSDPNDPIAVSVTADITDNEGDPAQDTFTVTFYDDGPSAALAVASGATTAISEDSGGIAVLTFDLDDTGSVEGADTATSAYTLDLAAEVGTEVLADPDGGIYSGLQTTDQTKIYLYQTSPTTVEGRSGNASGDVVFTVNIDASSGQIEVEVQTIGFYHDPNDVTLDTLVQMTGVNLDAVHTMTDGDGDTSEATTSLSDVIGFLDGEPVNYTPASAGIANVAGTIIKGDLDISSSGIGADGISSAAITSITIAGVLYTADGATALTSGGEVISLSGFGTGTITGSTDSGDVFTMTLDPDTNDCYAFNLIQPLDDGSGTQDIPLTALTNASEDYKVLTLDAENGQDILFSGYQIDTGAIDQTTVNPSNNDPRGSIGVANQSMDGTSDTADVLAMDFVTNAETFSQGNQEYYNYDAHYDVNDFSLTILQLGGGTVAAGMWVRVYDADNDDPNTSPDSAGHFNALLSGGSQDAITSIQVNGVAVDLAALQALGAAYYDGNGGYYIDGLGIDDVITVSSADGYNRIEIENPAGSGLTYDIGAFTYVNISSGSSIDFSFDTTLADGDGDTATGTVDLTVDPQAEANVLTGSEFSDTLLGGSNADTISGGAGNDILTGGTGDDIFLFTAADQGSVGDVDVDQITDFNDNGEADVLDLSDLLVGEEGTDLTAFLAVSEDAGAVVIDVNPDGLSGNTEQIRLEGTTLADLGANAVDTQADIISDLITNGHIQVDS